MPEERQRDKDNKYNLTEEELEGYMKVVNEHNEKYMDLWKKTPFEERVLFLPHCMRHTAECEAEEYEFGRMCTHCMKCQMGRITTAAEENNIPYYIVPGGSMLLRILNAKDYNVSMGIACPFELAEAMERCTGKGCPMVGVPLVKDGCKETQTDMKKALDMLVVT